MDMRYRAGLIGCGRIGSEFDYNAPANSVNTHAGAYTKHPGTELVAVCDVDMEKLSKCAEFWNVKKTYADYSEMLGSEQIDILSLCTKPNLRLPVIKEAVESGVKAIYSEKPIADSVENAKKIIGICRKKGVELFINHQRRFNPFFRELKLQIEKGTMGRIQHANVYYSRGIANTGSHIFDLMNYLFGRPDHVLAQKSRNPSNNPSDPNLDGTVVYRNGVAVALQACDDREFLIFEIEILGTAWRLKIGRELEYFRAVAQKHLLGSKTRILEKVEKGFIKNKSPAVSMLDGVSHVVRVLEGREQNLSSGEDGKRSLELITAFLQSARDGSKKLKITGIDKGMKISSN